MIARKVCLLVVCSLLVLAGCGGGSSPTPAPTPAPTITGHWTGTASSTTSPGAVSSLNGTLTQGVTNPDGSILFSGTINLTNSCFSTLTVSGKIAGNAFALSGTFSDGSTMDVTAQINAQFTQITGTYKLTAGSVCTADQGNFSLTKG